MTNLVRSALAGAIPLNAAARPRVFPLALPPRLLGLRPLVEIEARVRAVADFCEVLGSIGGACPEFRTEVAELHRSLYRGYAWIGRSS